MAATGNPNNRKFQYGLFSCSGGFCLYGFLCPWCLVSQNLKELGQSATCCGCPCVSLSQVSDARDAARMKYDIKAGSGCEECCTSCCCSCCVNIQIAREIRYRNNMQAPPEVAMV